MQKKKKINQPKRNGVANVPVMIQMEAVECGATCLSMISAYYGKWISPEQARIDCGVSRDGSKASNVVKAGEKYGFTVSAYRLEPEELKEEGTFPCIIHWNFNHFVVLDGFRGNRAYLNDPGRGKYSVSMSYFDECFTGVCLFFEPGEHFCPSGEKKSVLSFVKKRLNGLKMPVFIALLSALITTLIGIISPVFNKLFLDRLLTKTNPDWFLPFLISLSALSVIQIAVAVVTTKVNYRTDGKMSLVGNLSYVWKVLHLPMQFFSQRMVGDIRSRQTCNESVSKTLVNTLSPLFLNVIAMLFYLFVMIRYSVILTAIGFLSAVLNFAVSQWISYQRMNLARIKARETGRLASTEIAGIKLMETIKSSGAETGYFARWAGCFASVNEMSQRVNQYLLIVPSLISSVSSYLIIGMGVYLTVNGEFTLGSITAFRGFFSSFMSPVNDLIASSQTIQEMRTDMERIEDVMQYPDDENTGDGENNEENTEKLTGKIELKHVTFGYSPLEEPLIRDFSLNIERGQRIAFVGASGSGKSTIAGLIAGISVPISGEVLFDGKSIKEIGHSAFTTSLALVDQEIILFNDTVENNIKMWDDSIDQSAVLQAGKDAEIHAEILSKPGGYRHKVTEGGKGFSGGQRQRLEIARALAGEPSILILDEATSALDAETEYRVMENIKKRGITCIIVAHRLSAIRDCDKIIVLQNGVAVESGTHEELMKKNGYYKALVSNE